MNLENPFDDRWTLREVLLLIPLIPVFIYFTIYFLIIDVLNLDPDSEMYLHKK